MVTSSGASSIKLTGGDYMFALFRHILILNSSSADSNSNYSYSSSLPNADTTQFNSLLDCTTQKVHSDVARGSGYEFLRFCCIPVSFFFSFFAVD